jgi:hypothetical protein
MPGTAIESAEPEHVASLFVKVTLTFPVVMLPESMFSVYVKVSVSWWPLFF